LSDNQQVSQSESSEALAQAQETVSDIEELTAAVLRAFDEAAPAQISNQSTEESPTKGEKTLD